MSTQQKLRSGLVKCHAVVKHVVQVGPPYQSVLEQDTEKLIRTHTPVRQKLPKMTDVGLILQRL